ncbi:TetR/AcrR family transcriptional regulator [Facklamia lactis]|uniref:TetR/AcrR family transcriptional regulator n=1 Tax=Facklamia lactis TaxID=2749967 RepID=UPI0018CE9F16|nr:TetR/AcrR family transcriptional regulator [Facklamia lactis]MBG9979442.1 TetR/AcrR family transcriptional regulator [Facklamia lactis]
MSIATLNNNLERRDKLLNAALNEFIKYGYSEASTNRISAQAGISKQLIFHYVENKKGLYLWMIKFFVNELNNCYESDSNINNNIFREIKNYLISQWDLVIKYPAITKFPLLIETKNADLEEELSLIKEEINYEVINNIFMRCNTDYGLKNVMNNVIDEMVYWTIQGYIDDKLKKYTEAINFDHKTEKENLLKFIDDMELVFLHK